MTRSDADLMACPKCGAHRWKTEYVLTADLIHWERISVRCGECNQESRCQDLVSTNVVRRD